MRKWILYGLILLGMGSCDWFASKETRTRKLVDQEMQGINFNELDQFPLFEDCDETAAKFTQRDCFQNTLLLHLSMTLQDFQFRTEERLRDTVWVDFLVDRNGGISVLGMDRHPELMEQNPEFEQIISGSLRSLPRLQPALKRGVPVSAQFRIPLILDTDE